MNSPAAVRKLVASLSAGAIVVALVQPLPVLADGITLTRNCQDSSDSTCAVDIAPSAASAVAVAGPSTGIGPAIELNLAVDQVADAGTAVPLTRSSGAGGSGGGGGGSTQSAGAAVNGFAVSVGQSGNATTNSGNASADTTSSQAAGSSATQNPPGSGSDPGGGADSGGGGSPASGGSTSGINMITTVASIVQIVQVVARNNTNTTIAPIQLAEQCQQAAVSCTGNSASHP